MLPPPPLDGALPSRRPQRPSTQPPTATANPPTHAHVSGNANTLLSKRVLSVEEFRLERLERARQNPPQPPVSRNIPVPLYPNETQDQYVNKFKQWLAGRGERLDEMRGDPKQERKLWLTFAFRRAHPNAQSNILKTGTSRGQKRSLDSEYEDFYQRSASLERKRLRQRDASMESDRSVPRGRSSVRSFDERGIPTSTIVSQYTEEFTRTSSSRSRTHSSESRGDYHDEMPPRSTFHRQTLPRHQLPPPAHHAPRDEKKNQPFQPRSRGEILAPRVLSAEDYLHEIKENKSKGAHRRADGKLARIPMPLFPGETEYDYEEAFGRWLQLRQTSPVLLRDKPLKERVYRHQFARQRVMRKPALRNLDHPLSHGRSRSPQPKPRISHHRPQSPLSEKLRSNYVEPHEVPLTRYDDDAQELGDNKTGNAPGNFSRSASCSSSTSTTKSIDTDHTHHPTCDISRTTKDPNHEEERNSDQSDPNSNIPAQPSNIPESIHPKDTRASLLANDLDQGQPEPPKRQQARSSEKSLISEDAPEHEQAEPTKGQHTRSSRGSIASEDLSTHSLRISGRNEDAPDNPPKWALQLICRVQELESKVTQLQQEVKACHATGGNQDYSLCGHELQPVKGSGISFLPADILKQKPSQDCAPTAMNFKPIAASTKIRVLDLTAHGELGNGSSCGAAVPLPEKSGGKSKAVATKMPQTNEEIRKEASHNLARAVQLRVEEDPKKRQATEEYDQLNAQISINETAINDALDYIKTIKDVDEAVAMEQHSQIMELVVSINQEKEKRATALAKLIIYSWAGKKDMLLSALNEKPSAVPKHEASHEKLGEISSQIEQKDGELENLEMHLSEQLQWVSDIPSDVPNSNTSLRFKALRKLSKRLTKEQTARKQLEHQREEVLMSFLHVNGEIRKLVEKSL